MNWPKLKQILWKTWDFIWNDNSIWSWLANIVLAFVIIKFLVYPGLGLLLGSSYPIVAVVSSSMEHDGNFDEWWDSQKGFYISAEITKQDFLNYDFKNGFNKGDIMVLVGREPQDINIGEIIVFQSGRPDPIIHRVIDKWDDKGVYHFQTKGDNNNQQIKSSLLDETDISEKQLLGKAVVRIPLLGYVKIWFVEFLKLFMF